MNRSSGPEARVVITGVGMVTPVGNDVESAWSALKAGTPGGGPITLFEAHEGYATRIAAEVKEYDLSDLLSAKEIRRYDRFSHFALGSTAEALAWAGLEDRSQLVPERIGVIYGSGIGGIATFEANARILLEKGPKRVSPFFIPMFIPDIAAGLISIHFQLQGPNYATVSACASSAHAIGDAYRIIQRGDADLMIAGGSEATITPLAIAGFSAMKAMSRRNDDPEAASRPFDVQRDGFVIGEGAGTLVLESLEHAQARGAAIMGEVIGYAASADAYHITSPAPEGAGAQYAMRAALEDAEIEGSDVHYINAHGTSTQMNDANETAAIKAVFGDHAYDLVVSSTKSMTGHLLGASGAVEAVVCTLAIRDGTIPPTINHEDPDPACDLNYAPNQALEQPVQVALSNSFGFGGHNVCLVIRQFES